MTKMTGSNPEAVAATAGVFYIRITELETFVQAFADEIEFRAVQIGQAFRIDENPDAVRFENRIVRTRFVDIFEFVGHA